MRTERSLYDAIEGVLKESKQPVTANQLWDMAEIKRHAATANRVSDYLGNLWRKGVLLRLPAPLPRFGDSKARWMYQWKGYSPRRMPTAADAVHYDCSKHVVLDRPEVRISETGQEVTIETKDLTIVIRTK